MAFTPHTQKDIAEMLARIGAPDIDTLFDEIPAALRSKALSGIPEAQNEMEMLQHAKALSKNNADTIGFIGAGSYEHHIPAAVWDLTMRGEFLTAYTPYQAEASQGGLQLLYEFQTMIAELCGMDVANASMYDGATALAEAILMAIRLNRKSKSNKVLIPEGLHPYYRATVQTIVENQHIELVKLPYNRETGTVCMESLAKHAQDDITALVIAQPNFFGALEDVDTLTDWAIEKSAISIACVNPTSLALLECPGNWGKNASGVDIVCGEGQPLGAPMASGGPYFGFLSTQLKHVRQLPGRLVGKTVDTEGKTGYTLTLQAREQHIRRGKATSNICTNQGLLVTAATIYMSIMGAKGLQNVALQCHNNTQQLVEKLTAIPGVSRTFESPYFHEAVVEIDAPVPIVLAKLEALGISGGFCLDVDYPELKNCLLVCATEVRTAADIQQYADVLEKILQES